MFADMQQPVEAGYFLLGNFLLAGADLGRGCRGCAPPPPPPEMTCGFLIQLVFCKKKTMWFIGVEVEQETSAPPPKKILDPPLIGEFTFSRAALVLRVNNSLY